MCLEWKLSDNIEITDTDSQENGWSLVETIPESKETIHDITHKTPSDHPVRQSPSRNSHPVLRIPFADLKGVDVFKNEFKLISAHDSRIHSSFIFQNGDGIFKFLERQGYLKKCPHVRNFYNIYGTTDHDKLQRSFAELNIEDIRNNKPHSNIGWLKNINTLDTLEFFSRIVPAVQQQISPSRDHSMISPVVDVKQSVEFDVVPSADNGALDSNLSIETIEELDNTHLPERLNTQRNPPLTAKQWEEFKTEDGRIFDPDGVKMIIFKGVSNFGFHFLEN
jgi:hypothetical protein